MPRLPQPLTPEGLLGLMRDRAYWDTAHPRFPTYQRLVKRGFEILYPGPVRRDDTGMMIDVKPLPPERVAHLVAQTNREMDKVDEVFDERPRSGGEGMVHVQSHVRDGGKVEVADYWRAPPGQGAGQEQGKDDPSHESRRATTEQADNEFFPDPGSNAPIDPNDFYRVIEFDPLGNHELEAALRRPLDAATAISLRKDADDVVRDEYPEVHPHNNEADAFRHAYWSFEATRKVGPEAAKEFGDAHERGVPNPTSERLMDLYNNKVGRDLAIDPKNAGREGREVVREAIREGKLRTRPFETNEPRVILPDRHPGVFYRPPGGQRR